MSYLYPLLQAYRRVSALMSLRTYALYNRTLPITVTLCLSVATFVAYSIVSERVLDELRSHTYLSTQPYPLLAPLCKGILSTTKPVDVST